MRRQRTGTAEPRNPRTSEPPNPRTHRLFGRARPRAVAAVLGLLIAAALGRLAPSARASAGTPARVQFLFTSDSHYGLTRPSFRGRTNVSAREINQALVAAMNALPATAFPKDGGIGGGNPVGPFDFMVDGGDIANREEVIAGTQIQPAAASWAQFEADYVRGLTTTDAQGRRSTIYAVPGNHDVSDAIGFYNPMTPRATARRSPVSTI